MGRHCWLNMTKDNMVELAAQQILEYNISLFSLEIIPNLSGDLFWNLQAQALIWNVYQI